MMMRNKFVSKGPVGGKTDGKSPARPGTGGKKPEDGKKEKRDRKTKEPKKPETVDISWRLYVPPQVVQPEAEELEAEIDGEEKKSQVSDTGNEQINTNVDN